MGDGDNPNVEVNCSGSEKGAGCSATVYPGGGPFYVGGSTDFHGGNRVTAGFRFKF